MTARNDWLALAVHQYGFGVLCSFKHVCTSQSHSHQLADLFGQDIFHVFRTTVDEYHIRILSSWHSVYVAFSMFLTLTMLYTPISTTEQDSPNIGTKCAPFSTYHIYIYIKVLKQLFIISLQIPRIRANVSKGNSWTVVELWNRPYQRTFFAITTVR